MKKSKNTGQKNKHEEPGLSIIPAVILAIFVLLWQAAVDLLKIQPFILPGPIKVFKALYDERSLLLTHTLVTMGEALAGLGIAIVSGIIFGLLMGYYKPVRVALYPVFVITQTIPLIILAPLFAVWLGFGFLPKVIIIVLMCFFPISITFTQDLIKPDEDMDNILKVIV
jgi:putative hydroxymethylpyrimidine transport system permease protein